MKHCVLFVLISFLLLGCSLWKSGTQESDTEPRRLRVLTYNIHHGNPPAKKGVIDLDAIAAVIMAQQPDVVLLQEVDVLTKRSGGIDQGKYLAKKLGMQEYFAKAINFDGGEYGIVILSKLPMDNQKTHFLPSKQGVKSEARVLATANITLSTGKKITIGNTHLDSEADPGSRELQVTAIRQIVQKESLAFVLGGDLNATPESAVISKLDMFMKRTCKINCGFTFPADLPNRTIDYIAFTPGKGVRILTHSVIQEWHASDHQPIIAVFGL